MSRHAQGEIPEKNGVSQGTCQQIASSGAKLASDLQAVIEAWPNLPDALRAGIMAIIRHS